MKDLTISADLSVRFALDTGTQVAEELAYSSN